MHAATLHLAPILAAEKSKVPFYIAGGLLVAWALFVSLVLGLRRPELPRDARPAAHHRAISAVLVLAAVDDRRDHLRLARQDRGSHGAAATPTATTPTATTQAPATGTTGTPKATTGTPMPPSSPAAATSLKLAANPAGQLSYDTKTLSAKAGKVTIAMANMSPLEHNVTVAAGSKVLGATPTFTGGTKALTLKLKPGHYTFYCSVPGHRQAGMEGTLNVSS